MLNSTDVLAAKRILRLEMLEKRDNISRESVTRASGEICDKVVHMLQYKGANNIMLYEPIRNECDMGRLCEQAFADNKQVYLPFINEYDMIDAARIFSPHNDVIVGKYGILEPKHKAPIRKRDIDLIIVPGVSFDNAGNRLGFGKGYYDRFLSDTDCCKVGVCYDFQLVECLPIGGHDCRMDYIISGEVG